MRAIQYTKSIPRYLTVRSLAQFWSDVSTSAASCIQLTEVSEPPLPSSEWVRIRPHLSGICGSDLATIQAKGSYYLTPFVSFPFVLGHEVVGTISEIGTATTEFAIGDRVVIEPVLSCEVRGIQPQCPMCAQGKYGNCEKLTQGTLQAGLQTGYCQTTGGAWSGSIVAHPFQLHRVPDSLSDEAAVLLEPLSCAIHGVLKANLQTDQTAIVIGCGTIGLLTIAALRMLEFQGQILAIAKYAHQQAMATKLGANQVFSPGKSLYSQLCNHLGMQQFQPDLGKPTLTGGVDCVFDCVASSSTIDDALRFTRPQGKVILVGMPGIANQIDWTSLWYKELQLIGAYTYGIETYQQQSIRTFTLAIELMQQHHELLTPLITGRYSLEEYRTALHVASHPQEFQSIKTIFDLTK